MADQVVHLSPSRAADFKACPQLFKYRVIDRLPEPEDPRAELGSIVHLVLERLLALDPQKRSKARALAILQESWEEMTAQPTFDMLLREEELKQWLASAAQLLDNYFLLENPSRVQAHEMEWWVEHGAEGWMLRGIIDRVETLPDGSWVLTDYKTGSSPSERASFGSFFALRVYALLCWRAYGKLPRELRLVHLKKPEVIRLVPTMQMLEGVERQIEALASAIKRAMATGDFRPRQGPLCNWCPHKDKCPAWQTQIDDEESAKVILSA
jgi:putative RecB family exonuclease